MKEMELEIGDVVQLNDKTKNPMFRYCFMTVTEPKVWGAQGYVQSLGENNKEGQQAFYRSKWDEMEYVGKSVFVLDRYSNV